LKFQQRLPTTPKRYIPKSEHQAIMGKNYVQVPLSEPAVDPVKPQGKVVSSASRPVYKPHQQQKRQHRCCSPCCMILATLAIVIVVLPFVFVTIGAVVGYFFVAGQVKALTVTEPRPFPILEYPEAELQLAQDRIELFLDDLKAGRVPTPDHLVITADEVNGWIATLDGFRGNALVLVEENKLTIDTSFPLPSYIPGGKGRYFVSSIVANVTGDDTLAVQVDAPIDMFHGTFLSGLLQFSMDDEDNHHVITLLSGKAFDTEPNEMFFADNNNRLVLDGDDVANGSDDFIRTMDRIETIKLETGQIVIQARSQTADMPAAAADPDDRDPATPMLP
jgi:hypothetical protein